VGENSNLQLVVPQGRLKIAQDDSPGLDLKGRLVPKGRLKIGRDAILDSLQLPFRERPYNLMQRERPAP
jgi:hypothetical protein